MTVLRVSVVINSDARAESLVKTLEGLDGLDYVDIEVVVVLGPTPDRSREALEPWRDRIKLMDCPERNLSRSRNIGIAAAAGDVVAFIDDDAYPEPDWLCVLSPAFDDPLLGGTGGPVWNHTGAELQAYYSVTDRFANARPVVEQGSLDGRLFSSPGSGLVPYTIGTNALFRRSAMVEVGGFDEEFEYYLDETDVCLRLIDAGWEVRPQDVGYVHHKFLSSAIRTPNRAISSSHSVLKNSAYFALKHGLPLTSMYQVILNLADLVGRHRRYVESNVAHGLLTNEHLSQFDRDVHTAMDRAFDLWARPGRSTTSSVALDAPPAWKPFVPPFAGSQRQHVALLVGEYPPASLAGIGRVVHTLARAMARRGAVVHVITPGEGHLRVDLEDGVWVHRVPLVAEPPTGSPPEMPHGPGCASESLWQEVLRIHDRHPLDAVQVPNWDSLGVAALRDGRIPVAMGVYTPLSTVVEVDPRLAEAACNGDPYIAQLLAAEQWCYAQADVLLACGEAIAEEVTRTAKASPESLRWSFVPHGLDDRRGISAPARASEDGIQRVLFVGRLEPRKGVDVLLAAFDRLAAVNPHVRLLMAGRDEGAGAGEPWSTWQERAADQLGSEISARVDFLGEVSDDELDELYAAADLLVAPSRFESFGLILVEAMMFGRPVVASRVGGIVEIVDDSCGVLVAVEDAEDLAINLTQLLADPARLSTLGEAGRARFEERYSADRMAEEVLACYARIARPTGQ